MPNRYEVLLLGILQISLLLPCQNVFPIFATYTGKHDLNSNATGYIKYSNVERFYSTYMEFQIDSSHPLRTGFFNMPFFQFVGVFFGCAIGGLLSDGYGRCFISKIFYTAGAVTMLLSGMATNIEIFLGLRVVTGFLVGGCLVSTWTLIAEIINPKTRFLARAFTNFPNGRLLLVLICFLSQNWRISLFICAAISALTALSLHFFVPESPIWLHMKGRHELARKSNKFLIMMSMGFHIVDLPMTKSKQETIASVLRSPQLRSSFVVLCIMWFSTSFNQYAVDLHHVDLVDDFFLTQFILPTVVTLSKFSLGFIEIITHRVNRRNHHLTALSIHIIASFAAVILMVFGVDKAINIRIIFVIVFLVAYTSMEFVWDCCYLSVLELMPTAVRGTVSGAVSQVARVGALVASGMVLAHRAWEPSVILTIMIVSIVNLFITKIFLKDTKTVNLGEVSTSSDSPSPFRISPTPILSI